MFSIMTCWHGAQVILRARRGGNAPNCGNRSLTGSGGKDYAAKGHCAVSVRIVRGASVRLSWRKAGDLRSEIRRKLFPARTEFTLDLPNHEQEPTPHLRSHRSGSR